MALLLAGSLCPAPAGAEPTGARPIVRQQADRSCGLAVVSTLLNWSGRPRSEQYLYERLAALLGVDEQGRQQVNERGLAVGELRSIMLDQGLQPNGGRRTPQQVWRLAQKEPVVVVIRFADELDTPGHFTIVESSRADGGVDIADPALGRVRLTREEFSQRFAGAAATGVSFVPRTLDGRPLLPASSPAAATTDLELPSLQVRLNQLGRAELPGGRWAFDLDLRRAAYPSMQYLSTDELQVASRQRADSATMTVRYGLTDDVQVGMTVPYTILRETTRFETPEGSLEHTDRSRRFAGSIDLMASILLDRGSGDGTRYTLTLGSSIRRDGTLVGIGGSIGATWMLHGWSGTEVSSFLGVAGERAPPSLGADLWRATAGGSAVLPLSASMSAVLSVDIDQDLRRRRHTSSGAQVALSAAVADSVSIAPYLQVQRSAGLTTRSVGMLLSFRVRRDMP
jgi:predicted double-glycine peptidase